jgi:hypothetical protein
VTKKTETKKTVVDSAIIGYEAIPNMSPSPTRFLSPQDRIEQNKDLIKALAPQVQKYHLSNIGGKAYMNVGGGIAVANAMGYSISVGDVIEDKAKECFKAVATLHCSVTGAKIAEAVGYVGFDEDRWMKAPTYARLSMTQTRAEAKLCAANFRSVYTMLGAASDTPAEEMAGVIHGVQDHATPTPPKAGKKQGVKQQASPPSTVAAVPGAGTYEIANVREVASGTNANGLWKLNVVTTVTGEEFKTFDKAVVKAADQAQADKCECRIAVQPAMRGQGMDIVSFQALHEAVETEEIEDGLIVDEVPL